MKNTEAIKMACNNMSGRKKIGKAMAIIMFLALFVYLLVNSVTLSVNGVLKLFDEVPVARNIIYKDVDGTLYEQINSKINQLEHVEEVYKYVYEIVADIEQIKEVKYSSYSVGACSNQYEDYIVKGTMPKEGEILLPHYLFATEDGNYVNVEKYIGEDIEVEVSDCFDKKITHKFKVSGTYDNIYALMGTSMVLVNPGDATKLYDSSMNGIEELLEEKKKEEDDENVMYFGYEKKYYIAVVVDDARNIDTVVQQIYQAFGVSGRPELITDYNTLESVFPMIRLVCVGITIALLIVVLIMMISVIGNDINSRKKEMSVYMVQGYERKDLIKILSTEYLLRLVPILFSAVISSIGMLWIASLVRDKFLSMEYGVFKFEFAFNGMLAACVITVVVWLVAVLTISEKVKNIQIIDELKSEG